MTRADVGHLLHRDVGSGVATTLVAPLAVTRGGRAVRLGTEKAWIREGHAAALTTIVPRKLEDLVDSHVKRLGDQPERVDPRHGLAPLPAGNRLTGDKEPIRHLLLRQSRPRAYLQDPLIDRHGRLPRRHLPCLPPFSHCMDRQGLCHATLCCPARERHPSTRGRPGHPTASPISDSRCHVRPREHLGMMCPDLQVLARLP